MSIPQFSLRHLLISVALVAVACIALLNANEWWVGGMWFGAIALLSVATLMTIHRGHKQSAFWFGYAAFGWIGVVAGTQLLPSLNLASQLPQLAIVRLYDFLPESRRSHTIADPAWATDGIASVPSAIPPAEGSAASAPVPSAPLPLGPISAPSPAPPQIDNPRYIPLDAFLNVGEAIWRMLIAYFGGCISLAIARTRPKE